MATHSSILAWEMPWTEEPGRLQPMGSQRVGHMTEHTYTKPSLVYVDLKEYGYQSCAIAAFPLFTIPIF